MSKRFSPKVITANHLLEGDVIYFSTTGDWTRSLAEALLITDPDDASRRQSQGLDRPNETVGAYLADVAVDTTGKPKPLHFREEFRTRGPSNYPHGRQVEA